MTSLPLFWRTLPTENVLMAATRARDPKLAPTRTILLGVPEDPRHFDIVDGPNRISAFPPLWQIDISAPGCHF